MGRNPKHLLPQMRLHKGSGHARVRINGTEHWLGQFGSPEALTAYDRLIAEFLATRGTRPTPSVEIPPALRVHPEPDSRPAEDEPVPPPSSSVVDRQPTPAPAGITVAELCVTYLEFAKTHYVLPDGRLSSSYHGMLQAVNALRPFQRIPAAAFGPRCLREIVNRLAHEKGRNGKPRPRKSVNRLAKRIRGLFKWAVSMEIVPAQTWHALMAVEGLRRGRSAAPELPPIRPVADDIVKQTLPHLPKVVADLVWFIRLAGGGLDAAQVRLGHKHANITEVYAELAQEKAAELALKLG